tara:strand:+ start:782 stop:1501 length:720 start_codon:yes stop_codon:yes gene_type:complete
MIVSNYLHLPLSTTNASTESVRIDNKRRSLIGRAGKTKGMSEKAEIMSDTHPQRDFLHLNFDDEPPPSNAFEKELNQAIVDQQGAYSDQHHASWQRTTAVSLPDSIHLTTGKEPTLGLLFYQAPIKAKMMQWSSSMIPISLGEMEQEYADESEDIAQKFQRNFASTYLETPRELQENPIKMQEPPIRSEVEKIKHKNWSSAQEKERNDLVLKTKKQLTQVQDEHEDSDETKPPSIHISV